MRRIAVLGSFLVLASLAQPASPQKTSSLEARQRFVEVVLANFAAWDTNHDGQLDEGELTLEVQDPHITADAAVAVAAMKVALGGKNPLPSPPLTVDFFRSNDPALAHLVNLFKKGKKRLAHAGAVNLFNGEVPKLSGCKQGALGDCYLVAALGAAIARDPGVVNRMIQPEPGKTTFKVTYPDGVAVEVPPLTQGELAMGGGGVSDGLWLRVLEKAWGVRKIEHSTKLDAAEEPRDAMGHGGSVHTALQAMAVHAVKGHRLGGTAKGATVSVDELRIDLKQAFEAHRLVAADTQTLVSVPGISKKHAYAVIGYDAARDEVLVWNPHVNHFHPKGPMGMVYGYPTEDGQFRMPLSEFRAVFAGVSIESDEAPKKKG